MPVENSRFLFIGFKFSNIQIKYPINYTLAFLELFITATVLRAAMLTACRVPGTGSEHCGHWDTHTPGSGERLSREWRDQSEELVSGGWRWDTETGKGQELYVVHWLHTASPEECSIPWFKHKEFKIEDLLITVSLHKIELSITATNLCITEGCTNRNQPTSI